MKNFSKILRFSSSIPDYLTSYRLLKKSQWWERDRLDGYVDNKLTNLLHYAYDRVPYYRQCFKQIKLKPEDVCSRQDLYKFPVLDKSCLKEHFDSLIATDFPQSKLLLYSTGGSTGIPTRFYHDAKEMAWTEAAVHRSYNWVGYRRGEKFLLVAGLPEEKHSIISLLRRMQGQRRISLFGAGDDEVRAAVDYLLNLRPRGIKGYVSWLEILAQELKLRGEVWQPHYVITSSEKVTNEARARIETGFGSLPFENYSSREFMLAAECEQRRGLHIAAENVIIETVKDGKPVGPGEWGEILITDLNRYGMPLIRYAIGDVGVLSDRVCPCGRGLPILEEVVGRVSDIIRTPEGKMIAAPAVAHIFKDLPVEKFRVIQETVKNLIIRVVTEDGFSLKDEEHIRRAFKGIETRIEYVGDIPVAASGKNVIVESKLKGF